MLNSYSSAYNSLKINSTSGTLVKSHPKSFTAIYKINKDICLHTSSPEWYNQLRNRREPCVVIQTIVISGDFLMSEIVWLNDYLESDAQ